MISYLCDLARKYDHVLSWEPVALGFTLVSENLLWFSGGSSFLGLESRRESEELSIMYEGDQLVGNRLVTLSQEGYMGGTEEA